MKYHSNRKYFCELSFRWYVREENNPCVSLLNVSEHKYCTMPVSFCDIYFLSNINSCLVRGVRKLPPPQHGDTACGKGPYMAVTKIFFFCLTLNHPAFVLSELSIFLFGSFALQTGRNCLKGIIPVDSLIPLRWVSPCREVLSNVIYSLEINEHPMVD